MTMRNAVPDQTLPTTTDAIIQGRRSIRRFLPTAISQSTVAHILQVAARAPSGSNTQPWRVHVLAGNAKRTLSDELVRAHFESRAAHSDEYQYDSRVPMEPYASRRRAFGEELYGRLGIEYSDNPERQQQIARNYLFFDAPVGLIFTLHRDLGHGSWIDCGMFLQNIMVSARSHGLDTCAQVSFAKYHRLIKPRLGISDDDLVVCGMALGYADHDAPENKGWMPRCEVSSFARFDGF